MAEKEQDIPKSSLEAHHIPLHVEPPGQTHTHARTQTDPDGTKTVTYNAPTIFDPGA